MLFPIRKLFWGLVIIVIGLMAIYTFNTMPIQFLSEEMPGFFLARFDINAEANIPTWYSTVLLFSVAAAAFLNLRMENNQQIEYVLEEGLEMLGIIGVLMGCLMETNRLSGAKAEKQ